MSRSYNIAVIPGDGTGTVNPVRSKTKQEEMGRLVPCFREEASSG